MTKQKYFRRKIRLYANSIMQKELDKCIDYDRFCWNELWALKKEYNSKKEYDKNILSEYRVVRNNTPWQLELPQYILNRVHNELIKTDIQINKYNKETYEKKLKRPRKTIRFKSKRSKKQSFIVPNNCFSLKSFKPKGKNFTFGIVLGEKSTVAKKYRMMYIPELPPGILDGTTKIMGATIIREYGKYYISFCLKVLKVNTLFCKHPHGLVGIDPGIESAMTLSSGRKYHLPKKIKNLEKKAKYFRSRASKRKKSNVKKQSNRYYKARAKFVAAIEKIARIKYDWIHKITTQIANRYREIHWEKCEPNRLVKSHIYAKHIYDASWYTLMLNIKYKCEHRLGIFVEIDPKKAATQTCNNCGYRKTGDEKLTPKERVYICPKCGYKEDRDINAAKNIAKFN